MPGFVARRRCAEHHFVDLPETPVAHPLPRRALGGAEHRRGGTRDHQTALPCRSEDVIGIVERQGHGFLAIDVLAGLTPPG